MHPLFGKHGIISSTRFLSFSVADLGLGIRGLTGLGASPLLDNNSMLGHGVWSVSVVALLIITLAVTIVVLVIVVTVVVGA